MPLNPQAEADVLVALQLADFPEAMWTNQDDLCDCMYQRVGFWTNPYLAETLEVRFCCFWERWHKEHPELVRITPAYRDQNAKAWVPDPQQWNGEFDMPAAIWYRQLAREQGRAVADIRAEYSQRLDEKPRGKPRPVARRRQREWRWPWQL